MLEQGSTVSRDFHGGGADHMFMGVSKGVQRHIKAHVNRCMRRHTCAANVSMH